MSDNEMVSISRADLEVLLNYAGDVRGMWPDNPVILRTKEMLRIEPEVEPDDDLGIRYAGLLMNRAEAWWIEVSDPA